MMWYSKMKILAGTLLAVLLAGTASAWACDTGSPAPKAATASSRSAAAAALRSAARSEVRAPGPVFERMCSLILHLDLPDHANPTGTWPVGPFRDARADDVARVIKDLYGPSKVTAWSVATDDRANMLVFNGPDVRYAEIKKLVDKLDETAKHLPSPRSQVIRLKHASAASMAKILRDIYRDETSPPPFRPTCALTSSCSAARPPSRRRLTPCYASSMCRMQCRNDNPCAVNLRLAALWTENRFSCER